MSKIIPAHATNVNSDSPTLIREYRFKKQTWRVAYWLAAESVAVPLPWREGIKGEGEVTLILRQALGLAKARAQDRLYPLPSRERYFMRESITYKIHGLRCLHYCQPAQTINAHQLD